MKVGRTDWRTDSAITICLPKFLWGHNYPVSKEVSKKNYYGMANSANPDQMDPFETVWSQWSGFSPFHHAYQLKYLGSIQYHHETNTETDVQYRAI